MEKPISVIINEAKTELAETINKLQLHPSILEMIMKDLYLEIQFAAKQQTEKEAEAYQQSLEEEKKDKKKE